MSTGKVHQFKQTFIKYNLHINRRDYDGKWELVKKIPDPRFKYDSSWKGGRKPNGKIAKPMVWTVLHVYATRREAMQKAKEMTIKREANV